MPSSNPTTYRSPFQDNVEESQGNTVPPITPSPPLHNRQLLLGLQSKMRSLSFRRTSVSQNSMSTTTTNDDKSPGLNTTISERDSLAEMYERQATRLEQLERENQRLATIASEGESRSRSTEIEPAPRQDTIRMPAPGLPPFLRLPSKLRLLIFGMVHGPTHVYNPISEWISQSEYKVSAQFHGLLRVSKMISSEAAIALYSENKFDFIPGTNHKRRANEVIVSWLKTIGDKNRENLRHLNFHFEIGPGEALANGQLERLLLAAGSVDEGDNTGLSFKPGPFFVGVRNALKDFERNTIQDIVAALTSLQVIPKLKFLGLMILYEHGSVTMPSMAIANINKKHDFCFLKGAMLEYDPIVDALAKIRQIDRFHFHGFVSSALLERLAKELNIRLMNIYLDSSPEDELIIRHAHKTGWTSCKNLVKAPGDWSTCLIHKAS